MRNKKIIHPLSAILLLITSVPALGGNATVLVAPDVSEEIVLDKVQSGNEEKKCQTSVNSQTIKLDHLSDDSNAEVCFTVPDLAAKAENGL